MPVPNRIYLDNAATSWPKPDSVYESIDRYLRDNGIPVGRTTGRQADEVAVGIAQLRLKIRKLVQAADAEVVFAFNGTDALNLAIHGTLRPGDHVVTTVSEHNSVLRPLRFLEDRGDITVDRVSCDATGRVDSQQVLDAVQPETRMVAMIHGSNVTGGVNDLFTVGDALRQQRPLFLVDAAQSLGTLPIEFDRCGIDFLASPGHKGLYGPLGTGMLVVSRKGQGELRPIRQGGTGASSDSDQHPTRFPEAFEPGNHNVPGLIGLAAGLDFIEETGIEKIALKKSELANRFCSELSQIRGVEPIESTNERQAGIVSFNLPIQASELAVILDSSFGIQIRAGYHCASLIHQHIGCPQGCARVSFGYSNTMDEVEMATGAIRDIAQAF